MKETELTSFQTAVNRFRICDTMRITSVQLVHEVNSVTLNNSNQFIFLVVQKAFVSISRRKNKERMTK